MIKKNIIIFGDSHSRCFNNFYYKNKYINIFSGATAKGLNNKNSISQTNKKIKNIINNKNDDILIFFFGRVDIDFIVHYKMMLNQNIDEYINEIIKSYFNFINSLNKKNIIILGIYPNHLNRIQFKYYIKQLNKNINKFISFDQRYDLVKKFNILLKNNCKKNNYSYFDINDELIINNKIQDIYQKKNDAHLNYNIINLWNNKLLNI